MMELNIRYYRGYGRVGSCDGEDGGDDALSVGRVGPRHAGRGLESRVSWHGTPHQAVQNGAELGSL